MPPSTESSRSGSSRSGSVGHDPEFWLEPLDTLPVAEVVTARIRAASVASAVALIGYDSDSDPEASEASRHLPYGVGGEGIEQIVFVRTGPPVDQIVEFDDDAWPGEDRTYVQDDLDAALELVRRFAREPAADGLTGSVVLTTGHSDFLSRVADKLR